MGNRRIRGWLLVIAGVLALAATGCGESSSAGSSNEAQSAGKGPLTKTQFTREANKICRAGLKEKDQVVATMVNSMSPEELAEPAPEKLDELVSLMLVPARKVTAELSKLQPSEKDQAAVDEIIAKFEAGIKKAESQPRLFVSGAPLAPAGAAARALGLDECNY